jgi:hypothetical protein
MKTKNRWKKNLPLLLVGSMIPATIILSSYFVWLQPLSIPLVIILGLIFTAMTLWAYANRKANGSEWWQDDSASGWRGY